ncbi:MAG: hypothetical protein J0H98_08955 [Solirubrobacterales bacterium]|nr:hypothetical protein [Solirubrobacterales bacterium]
MRVTLGLSVLVAVFGASTGTSIAGTTILPNPDCCTFEPGPYSQDLGDVATFDNTGSTSPHNVTSTATGPDGRPLFYSVSLLGGQSAEVKGTQYLPAGTYPFICTFHSPGMSGELIVDGGKGTIAARPTVRVSFAAQRLATVKRRGVKVKVKAVTASSGVAITAFRGKLKLGSKAGIKLAAGQTRTVTLPLTKAARRAIRKAKAVPIKLKATVLFGKPSTANRRVR